MKKNLLLMAISLLLLNGCSDKTVRPEPVKQKRITSQSVISKINKNGSEKTKSKELKKEINHKQWGAPTISEEEASKLFGFSLNK